ncbi:TPA: DUF417 family protein [Pseudomonas putida]|nr:DUF417 family protein [Pseudomonas putida]
METIQPPEHAAFAAYRVNKAVVRPYGFPYLSGAGRLVLKDVLMLAGAVVMIADSARRVLNQKNQVIR